jgi:GTP pyrophosphokinase
LPGDEIIGFVTKGFGISVHKTDCPNMLRARKDPENADRWVSVHWESEISGSADKSLYEAVVQIYVRDEIGALAEISMALAEMKVSIMSISSRTMAEDGLAVITLSIGCKNVTHFHSIVSKLKSIKAVQSVSRGYSAL